MTPIAHRLAKQLVLPLKKREKINDEAGIMRDFNDFHCFETSKIRPLVSSLIEKIYGEEKDIIFSDDGDPRLNEIDHLIFLPAPKTWIESGGGIASFYVDKGDFVNVAAVFPPGSINKGTDGENDSWILYWVAKWDMRNMKYYSWDNTSNGGLIDRPMKGPLYDPCQFALINSPKIIGRKQFMPHRGLERKLTQSLGKGKFPLHAWTEIELSVTKPIEIDDGEPHEAHLTGKRALHFVRKHIRIRFGQLEYVTSHWRGDPAIGMKQSRYSVVP